MPYEERLSVPRVWWLLAGFLCALVGVVLLPLGLDWALAGLAASAAAVAVALSAYGAPRIRVAEGYLLAGQARIPLAALGRAEALDAEEARAWRTHRADARAFLLLRGYIATAARVEVVDRDDPTPYLYLSTRSPRRLVAALEAATTQRRGPV